ncbi:MAG: ECF transporter S component [bacterium]|nr:ECF transporter S component [bacterium]
MKQNTKKWILAALLAALTCLCTMVVKIPTPTGGYIHPGDGMVLLCGILLGPGMGALAAGIGSMFSDIISGYLVWAPATFIIKALAAGVSALLFQKAVAHMSGEKKHTIALAACGVVGEALMVFGYFVFEIGLNAASNGGFTAAAIAGGIAYSAAGIPANCLQGITGVVIACVLLPILNKVPDVRAIRQGN